MSNGSGIELYNNEKEAEKEEEEEEEKKRRNAVDLADRSILDIWLNFLCVRSTLQ